MITTVFDDGRQMDISDKIMAETMPLQGPQQVLLDRLTRAGSRQDYDNQALKISVLREIDWLFNTVSPGVGDSQNDAYVTASVLNYGTPDCLGQWFNIANLQKIAHNLKVAIIRFEPRIIPDSLNVSIRSRNAESASPSLSLPDTYHIHISGQLWSQPKPVEFSLMKPFTVADSTIPEYKQ